MRKLIYKITEEGPQSQSITHIEFITDRTPDWTESQYLRNRGMGTTMELVSDEETEEKEPTSRKVKLG
tara:strand:- start:1168 stop:1371 length:204 start_codon:yes stop_codon:yes gene_type:complete